MVFVKEDTCHILNVSPNISGLSINRIFVNFATTYEAPKWVDDGCDCDDWPHRLLHRSYKSSSPSPRREVLRGTERRYFPSSFRGGMSVGDPPYHCQFRLGFRCRPLTNPDIISWRLFDNSVSFIILFYHYIPGSTERELQPAVSSFFP